MWVLRDYFSVKDFWLTKCKIMDYFRILIHWRTIVTTSCTFKNQSDYYPLTSSQSVILSARDGQFVWTELWKQSWYLSLYSFYLLYLIWLGWIFISLNCLSMAIVSCFTFFCVEFTTSVNDYGDETNISSEYHEY